MPASNPVPKSLITLLVIGKLIAIGFIFMWIVQVLGSPEGIYSRGLSPIWYLWLGVAFGLLSLGGLLAAFFYHQAWKRRQNSSIDKISEIGSP